MILSQDKAKLGGLMEWARGRSREWIQSPSIVRPTVAETLNGDLPVKSGPFPEKHA